MSIEHSKSSRKRPEAQEGPLRILYEDEWLLALDKPPGMVVHPTYKNTSGTMLNAVLWRVRERADASPGILTRLDKQTSGVVIVALTSAVHARLQRTAAAGHVRKEYLAVVEGTPEPALGSIVLPLGRDPLDRRRVIVIPGGAYCETRYELARSLGGGRSLVRCALVTGRTHQIRVHMASRGWPIVGDHVYGQPDAIIGRQALHAWKVTLRHPSSGETLHVESPVPGDMQALGAGETTLSD